MLVMVFSRMFLMIKSSGFLYMPGVVLFSMPVGVMMLNVFFVS